MSPDLHAEEVREKVQQFEQGVYESESGETLDPDSTSDQRQFAREVLLPFFSRLERIWADELSYSKVRGMLQDAVDRTEAVLDAMEARMALTWEEQVAHNYVENMANPRPSSNYDAVSEVLYESLLPTPAETRAA